MHEVNIEASTPLVAEKPYVASEDGSAWHLIVPRVQSDKKGLSWDDPADVYDFSHVYVTSPDDSAALSANRWSEEVETMAAWWTSSKPAPGSDSVLLPGDP